MPVEKGKGFREGGDLRGGDDIRGDLHGRCMADGADVEYLLRSDLKNWTSDLQDLLVAADVINQLPSPSGIAAAGEWSIEKSCLAVFDDFCGLEGLGGRYGRVIDHDMGRGEGGGHVADDGKERLAIRDKNLNEPGGLRDLGR